MRLEPTGLTEPGVQMLSFAIRTRPAPAPLRRGGAQNFGAFGGRRSVTMCKTPSIVSVVIWQLRYHSASHCGSTRAANNIAMARMTLTSERCLLQQTKTAVWGRQQRLGSLASRASTLIRHLIITTISAPTAA